MDEKFDTSEESLSSRAPRQADPAALARILNAQDARYIVIGGFAIITSGFPRATMN